MKNGTKATRYGSFIGEQDKKSNKVFSTLRLILKEALSDEGSFSDEYLLDLKKINQDLSKNSAISKNIKEDKSDRFTLSPQELTWLAKHDSSQWIDYLIYRYRFKIYPRHHKLLKFPVHLLIEMTSICNFRCTICFQSDKNFLVKKNLGIMPLPLFKRLVDEAKNNNCQAITLASRGEPLLYPHFSEAIDYIKKAGIMDLKINTNASLLNEKKSHDILKAGVNELVFSVDAASESAYKKIRRGGNFKEVLKNIKQFHKIREAHYPKSPTVTRVQLIIIPENVKEIEKASKFWSKIVDHVVIKKVIKRWDSYGGKTLKNDFPCQLLWERVYVWFDGKVNPCDFDYNSSLTVGNANKNTISDIWINPAFNRLRSLHEKGKRDKLFPCDRCHINS